MSWPPLLPVFEVRSVCCDWNTSIVPSCENAIAPESLLVALPRASSDSLLEQVEYHGSWPVASSQPEFVLGTRLFGHRLERPPERLSGDGTDGILPSRW